MNRTKVASHLLIKAILLAVVFFSGLALVYHIRWFIPFLQHKSTVPYLHDQASVLWYVVQLCNNLVFLFVGVLLMKLLRNYNKSGFFDARSLQVFDILILSCILLALLGSLLTVYNNFNEVHFDDWTSIESVANLLFRSFTRLLVFKEPQTMYFLLAIILWVVRQFVSKALLVKEENEAFV
jgi:hypothetical protein